MESNVIEISEKPLGENDSCDCNPEFAVICSFIERFGSIIDLDLDIEHLKNSIEDRENLDDSLIEIHVKLIKKIRKYFNRDQWERALIRFAAEYSYEDAYEIERFGYLKTRPSVRLELLRRLLDAQFECDQKFKALVNSQEANDLRLQPSGRDFSGNTYWHNTDKEGNLRIYQEEPFDYKSWKAVCRNADELQKLIERLDATKDEKLKGEPRLEPYNPYPQIFPDLFVVKEEPVEEKRTSRGRSKPAKKSRGRPKKSNRLSILKEEEAENIEQSAPEKNAIKTEINASHDYPISTLSHDSNSIESQVRQTVEGIINKVVSSIDYFLFRPLSRNFTDSFKSEPEDGLIKKEPIDSALKCPPPKKRKKREKVATEEPPRRSSSRIQLLQQKKEQEELQKALELSKKEHHEGDDKTIEKICEPQTNGNVDRPVAENKVKKGRKVDKQRWRNTGKKSRVWDKDDSDLSSTSSLTESEIEEDISFNECHPNNDDDEFACEEEETNLEPVIVKRARTARQSIAPNEDGIAETSTHIEEDKPCGRCAKSNDPDCILLCDICDDGYHLACCIPPLMIVPDGDWYCPSCEHTNLLAKLDAIYHSVTKIIEEKERERMKRERLRAVAAARRQTVKEERSRDEAVSAKRQRSFLQELNEPMAVQQLDEQLDAEPDYELPRERVLPNKQKKSKRSKPKTRKRRKDYYSDDEDEIIEQARKNYKRQQAFSDDETDEEDEFSDKSTSEESYQSARPKTRRARACVSYKFKEYDELIKSAICGESGNEDPSDSKDSEPEPCNYGRGKDMATIEALAYQQENGLLDQEAGNSVSIPQKPKRPRKKGRRLNDLDAESEIDDATSDESFQASSATEAEDEDEDEMTDEGTDEDTSIDEIVSSKYFQRTKRRVFYDSDDSSEFDTRTRRCAVKQVSYAESTDEDEAKPAQFYRDDEVWSPPSTSPDRQRTW